MSFFVGSVVVGGCHQIDSKFKLAFDQKEEAFGWCGPGANGDRYKSSDPLPASSFSSEIKFGMGSEIAISTTCYISLKASGTSAVRLRSIAGNVCATSAQVVQIGGDGRTD